MSLVLGIFFQEYFSMQEQSLFASVIVCLCANFLVYSKSFFIQKIRSVFIALLFFSFGALLHFYHSEKPDLPAFSKNGEYVFALDKKLNSNVKNRRYVICVKNSEREYLSVLSVPKNVKELDFEHIYRAKLRINQPDKLDNDFQFDYGKYLSRQSIYLQSYLPNDYETAENRNLNFLEKIKQNRLELLHKIDSSGMSANTNNFLKGIILADRTEMDQASVQDFNKSGLVHFLAISGTHIVIIYWLIMIILENLFSVNYRKQSIILSLLLIWLFAVYIGFGSSVVRSCIMITVYYLYIILQRKPDLLHSLSLAGLVILFLNTQQLFDVGFQLSFLAVFGIFLLNQPILDYFPVPKNWFQKLIFNTVSISVSAQLITLPLVLYYFHQFSWMSIPANLLIIPFSEMIIVFSLLMTLLFGFGINIGFITQLYDKMTYFLLKIIHGFADQDFAFYKMIPMNIVETFMCLIIVFSLRSILIKFSLKSISRTTVLVVLFVAARLLFTLNENRKNEIVVAKYFKDNAIIQKNKSEVKVFVHQNSNIEKIRKNIIEPYLTSRRTDRYKEFQINKTVIYIENKQYNLKND